MLELTQRQKGLLRNILSACIIIAGISHFAIPSPYIRIVPDLLPYPAALVYLSGAIEIFLGIALTIPSTRQWAAWGLIALFIAVYPANINMAVNRIPIDGIPNTWWFHTIRLPFQFVLIIWAYWYTKPESRKPEYSERSPNF